MKPTVNPYRDAGTSFRATCLTNTSFNKQFLVPAIVAPAMFQLAHQAISRPLPAQ
jgi:hypothetical protein